MTVVIINARHLYWDHVTFTCFCEVLWPLVLMTIYICEQKLLSPVLMTPGTSKKKCCDSQQNLTFHASALQSRWRNYGGFLDWGKCIGY